MALPSCSITRTQFGFLLLSLLCWGGAAWSTFQDHPVIRIYGWLFGTAFGGNFLSEAIPATTKSWKLLFTPLVIYVVILFANLIFCAVMVRRGMDRGSLYFKTLEFLGFFSPGAMVLMVRGGSYRGDP